uniref:Fibronectin type-III domain-containing protein n=1 Tax=Oryctolagus cuniculus TaxID=9986 RepID=A0A5F9CPZ5_RABIT
MAAGAVLATGAGPGVVGAGSLWAGGVQALRCAARCLSLRLLERRCRSARASAVGNLCHLRGVSAPNQGIPNAKILPGRDRGTLPAPQTPKEPRNPQGPPQVSFNQRRCKSVLRRPSVSHQRSPGPQPGDSQGRNWPRTRSRGSPGAPRRPQTSESSTDPLNNGSLVWCQNDKQCSTCLEPCKHPGELETGPCQSLCETTDQRVWLPDVRPGGWYQFRVAAVNVHGTQGFTTPVRHFRSSRAPLAPLALADLRVNSTVRDADGTVAATVIWEPPEDPDVPVHHYRVSWGHATEGQWQRKLVDGHWSSVTLQHLRPGSVYTVQLQPLGADVAARPQGCPALHSCQRHIVPIGPQLQCKALTESASLGLPRSLCSECSCQSWVISILNGLPRSLCGKGTCQSWVTMETPHGLPRSLCSWGFCQSYVTMETPRGLPRSLCSKRSYQSCVICVPNRLPRSLCGRGSCQSVHSSNSYTQDCHTHEHACANLATYVCTHMAATRRSGVTTFDGEAAERPQGHNL